MALQVSEIDPSDEGNLIGEWRFDPRPFFMGSDAYTTLVRSLRGYLRGEVMGRSFLIAAHRGVGKTSLVQRAVSQANRDAVRDANAEGSAIRRQPQRPLLVKLHARTMVADPPPAAGPTPTTPPRHIGEVRAKAEPEPSAEAALQQMAIALYRALAQEVAASFALHALEADGKPGHRMLTEMGAQLTLDLDLAPEVSALRNAWNRLGRLRPGVLWPGPIGSALVANGLTDLGMREIVAIATANQAFQVCAGRVEASQRARNSAERLDRVESAGRLDLKDTANKLFGLTAGALVGAAALHTTSSAAAAAASGLGTALLGSLALGWSMVRKQRTERSTDYTFIMDHSLQTLDRDLPTVIERVRQAGLAPVFLVDELDKLDKPGACLEAIIRRLKNLTTDYGFFCFLTDRGYFEEIEQKVRRTAYPSEHTYFSHRLLLLYRPAEMAHYVRRLLTAPPMAAQPPVVDPDDNEAAWILTTVVLHRAKLNAMDLRRELVQLCDDTGGVRPASSDVVKAPEYYVPMATQLAIEHVLRHPDIRLRVENDTAFAQLAQDVLYMISRAWEDGQTEIVINETTVRETLIARRTHNGNRSAAETELAAAATDSDIETLTAHLLRLASLLTSFPTIGTAILTEPGLIRSPQPVPPYQSASDSNSARLSALLSKLSIPPSFSIGLLTIPDDTRPDTFRFLYDRYCVQYVDWNRFHDAVQQSFPLIAELKHALKSVGFGFDHAIAVGLLPPAFDGPTLDSAVHQLRHVPDGAALRLAPREAVDLLASLPSALRQRRSAIVGLMALAKLVHEEGAQRGALLDGPGRALEAIDRMLGLPPLIALLSDPSGATLPRDSLKSPDSAVAAVLLEAPSAPQGTSMRHAIDIEAERQRGQLTGADAPLGSEMPWRTRLEGWLIRQERQLAPPIVLADIVDAAAGIVPAYWLRPDLGTLTIAEWSRLAMLGFAGRKGSRAEGWVFAAALRALGFGVRILSETQDEIFSRGARPDQPGRLLEASPGAEFAEPPNPAEPPSFVVPSGEADTYIEVVEWLASRGAFAAMLEKED